MNGETLKVWAIAGSLRADSWNRKLLEAAAALAPADVEVHVSDLLPQIPFFNEDLIGNEPEAVQQLRAEVAGRRRPADRDPGVQRRWSPACSRTCSTGSRSRSSTAR